MEPIESASDVGRAVESSAEAPQLKRKDTDHPPQRPESPACPEHLALSRSPETFLDVLAGKCVNTDPASQLLNDDGAMVEELTVKNYMSPGLCISGSSSGGSGAGGGESSVRRGMWQNFTRIATGGPREATGGPREAVPKGSLMGSRGDVGTSFSPQPRVPPPPFTQLGSSYANVSEHFHGNEKHTLSHSAPTSMPAGIRMKTLPVSGFPQYTVKSNLKGKRIADRHQETHGHPGIVMRGRHNERSNEKADVPPNLLHRPGLKADGKALFCGGGDSRISDAHCNGISLREWLKQRHHKFNKPERMHIFRQILELVDITHSQGLALQHLRPSYFMLSPVNQIKYIGSLVPEGQLMTGLTDQNVHYIEHPLKMKRNLEQEKETHLSAKHQRHGEHSQLGLRHNMFPWKGELKGDTVEEIDASCFRNRKSENDYRMQQKFGEKYYTSNMSQSPPVSNFGFQLSKPEFRKLEERWYASPEELNERLCSLSTNIYNLGVLLFELLCSFETWEVHSASMSNLHHRILPPNFLSESPKEASFCLWLLHPEPSSRPKSRDILKCDLICEGRDLSSLDQSSSSIDEEDAEADLLAHFLLTLKEHKEKQAAKLVTDLGCLQADIKEVERRRFSRTKFFSSARDLWTNSNGISDMCPHRGSMHVEAMPSMSVSGTNDDRLLRNIDQLENAYFSMRSKIELSETSAGVSSDKDVLKIRDRCFHVQSEADIQDSTDRLGMFFDGLCKYSRFSRFEVRGRLRNVDILNSANVICSLSFDRDEEYFAAAGASKKIKIFEFSSLLNDSVDIHYPLVEMSSRSQLSCLCWNNYIKNYLASTDYEGGVQLWDATTGQGFTRYTEHQKRAWSVDFSQTDPIKLASGSDDCSVKLWSINEKNCISTIRNMANICCVQFSSYSSQLLAFGSADYKICCYDLRNTRIPWCTLSGHGKAVSYVKFIDSETLVSASTDNTLKLWDLNKTNAGGLSASACSLTFSGHTNEKNFIGLSVSDGYIACGSETNEVYAYYKTLPMPITSHKFGSIDQISGQETGDDGGQFVSTVCWRTKSNMVVTANSSGSIKLLQLV